MIITDQKHEILTNSVYPVELVEKAGRICYQSEKGDNSKDFVKKIIAHGHESVIEHASASVLFTTNRGVTHELVRHRIASYSQESTRYVRYDGKMEFIRPVWWDEWSDQERRTWEESMKNAETAYCSLIKSGSRPEQAREVLPNSLKTEIMMTANFRVWRHVFKLRCSTKAHPQIRALLLPLQKDFNYYFLAFNF